MNKTIILIITIILFVAGCALYESSLPAFSENPVSVLLSRNPAEDEAYFAVTDSAGNLYVATNEGYQVKAFNNAGEDLWSVTFDFHYIIDMRALDDSRLIVSTIDGYYYVLMTNNGGKIEIDDSAGSFDFYPADSDGAGGFYYMKAVEDSGDFRLMQVTSAQISSGSPTPALVKDDFDSVISAEGVSYSYLNSDTVAKAPVVNSDGSVFIFFDGEYKDNVMKVEGGMTSRIFYSYRIYSFSMLGDNLLLYNEPYDESIHRYEAIQILDADGTLIKEVKIEDIGPQLPYMQDEFYSFYEWGLTEDPIINTDECLLVLGYASPEGNIAGCVVSLDSTGNNTLKMQQVFAPRFLSVYGDGFFFMDSEHLYQTGSDGDIIAYYDVEALSLGEDGYASIFGLMPDGQNGLYLLSWQDMDQKLDFYRMPAGSI